MATVRFSQELRAQIMRSANNIFNSKITAVQSRPVPPEWTGDTIYDAIFSKWRTHMEALPREFFYQYDHINIRHAGSHVVRAGFQMPVKRSFPPHIPDSEFVTRSGYGSTNEFDLRDHSNSPFRSLLDHYKQVRADVEVLEEQRQAFAQGVQKVLEAHATLAPALKAWPALWDLLSEDTKNKHRLVTSKAGAAKPDLDGVDVASLTATVVMNKLGV